MSGLFANRTNSGGLAFRVYREREAKAKLDRFADLLADGRSPEQAAILCGHTPTYGRVLLGKLRKKLGWQAQ